MCSTKCYDTWGYVCHMALYMLFEKEIVCVYLVSAYNAVYYVNPSNIVPLPSIQPVHVAPPNAASSAASTPPMWLLPRLSSDVSNSPLDTSRINLTPDESMWGNDSPDYEDMDICSLVWVQSFISFLDNIKSAMLPVRAQNGVLCVQYIQQQTYSYIVL